jgi:hypothetical protein
MSTTKNAAADVNPRRQRTQYNCNPKSGQRGIDWETQPLGKMSDCALALRLGVSSAAVRKARLKLDVPTYFSSRWQNVPLGKVPDKEIASQTGISRRSVSRARHNVGLHGPSTINWDRVVELGKITDTAIGISLGVDPSVVGAARRLRGIPAANRKYTTLEGEPATFPEALIDLFWHKTNVPHRFQVRVGSFIADWEIAGELFEYAGFDDSRLYQIYENRLNRKLQFYRSCGLSCSVIRPVDLPGFFLGTYPPTKDPLWSCSACACPFAQVKHHAHGLCRKCYRSGKK